MMTTKRNTAVISFLLLLSSVNCSPYGEIEAAQCGGALEGDTGVISYPSESGVVQQDELCIWTIHLLTKTSFKLNISEIDFNGGTTECSQGALRAYSLTNLVPQNNMEGYTICPENNGSGGGILFLNDNVMVVTFRTSNSTQQGGRGFTFSWEGLRATPSPISHASSASSTSDGIIRYPVFGEYNTNILNTWLVSLNRRTAVSRTIDLSILSSNIETCGDLDEVNCYCDAAIVYTVNSDGSLQEVKRLCGDLSSVYEEFLENLNFIVAFFSDAQNVDGNGSGFELIWSNRNLPTTTTTPRPTGPTTPEPDVISTDCNEVVELAENERGRILYTWEGAADKVCTWTIRADGSANILVILEEISENDRNETHLDVHTFAPYRWNDPGPQLDSYSLLRESEEEVPYRIKVAGPVVVLTLSSPKPLAFQILIERETADENSRYPIVSFYSDRILVDSEGSVTYPEVPPYEFDEFSTFIINPNEGTNSSYVKLNFPRIDVEGCWDEVNIFVLQDDKFVLTKMLCGTDSMPGYFADRVFLLLFTTDDQNSGEGFDASWKTVYPAPASECGGTLDLSRDVGAIHYIESGSVDEISNENCVWTIRAHKSRTISLTLGSYLFEENCNENNLYVTGFTGNFSQVDGVVQTEKKNVGTCDTAVREQVVMTGPVVFVVFSRTPGRFQVEIEYEALIDEVEFPYLSNYTDIIRTDENGSIYYPGNANWPKFQAYEWTTFLINPQGRNNTSRLSLKFTTLNIGQENSCWSTNIMTYEIRDGLIFQYMICRQGQIGTVEIFGDRTILLVLRTSSLWSSYANGLAFNWAPRNVLDSQDQFLLN